MPEKKIMVKVSKPKTDAKGEGASKSTTTSTNIELTKRYSDQQDKMIDAVSVPKVKKGIEETQGISVNKNSLEAKPIKFKRKVVRSEGPGGTTKIIGTDGKTVKYEGSNNMKATEDAVRQNEKEENYANERREYNSNFYNVNSGAKKNLSEGDKAKLVKIGKAVVKK